MVALGVVQPHAQSRSHVCTHGITCTLCVTHHLLNHMNILITCSHSWGHLYFLCITSTRTLVLKLEGTARYADFTSSSCGGLPPQADFFVVAVMLFWLTLSHFWCSVVTSVTINSPLCNFFSKSKKNSKNPKKSKISKNLKNSKIPKNPWKLKKKNLQKTQKSIKNTHIKLENVKKWEKSKTWKNVQKSQKHFFFLKKPDFLFFFMFFLSFPTLGGCNFTRPLKYSPFRIQVG